MGGNYSEESASARWSSFVEVMVVEPNDEWSFIGLGLPISLAEPIFDNIREPRIEVH